MVLNDITNDSAAKGVGSDTYNNDGMQKNNILNDTEIGSTIQRSLHLNSPVHLSLTVVVVQNGVLWLL
jgi:hypothetical protein